MMPESRVGDSLTMTQPVHRAKGIIAEYDLNTNKMTKSYNRLKLPPDRRAESFSAENRCSVCGASSHKERSCPYGPDTSFTTDLPRTLGIMGMVAVIAGGAYIWTQRATNGGNQGE